MKAYVVTPQLNGLHKTILMMGHNISLDKTFITVKILKFGTPQTIAIIVLEIEKFDVTSH